MNELARGDWMQTISGLRFHPLDPQPDEIAIDDIAHALAMVCRFSGHVTRFYSVAEHSVWVSTVAETAAAELRYEPHDLIEVAMAGLLHDSPEAYLGDMVRPLKRSMPEYRNVEKRVEAAIAAKFGLSDNGAHLIKAADVRMLATEREQLMRVRLQWVIDEERVTPVEGVGVLGLPPERARVAFLVRFGALMARREAAAHA